MARRPPGYPAAGSQLDEAAQRQAKEYRAALARMRARIAKLAADPNALRAGQATTVTKINATWDIMKADLGMFVQDRSGMFTTMAEELFTTASEDAIARVNKLYADNAIRAMSEAQLRQHVDEMLRNPINGGSLSELIEDADARTMTRVRSAFMSSAVGPEADFATVFAAVKAAFGRDLTGMLQVVDTVGGRVLNEAIDLGFRWSAEQWTRELVGDAVDQGELVEVWRHDDAQPNPRPDHISMNGQIKGADGLFYAPDGASAEYPGGFGDPAHDAWCRCWVEFMPREEAERLYGGKTA